MSGTGSNMPRFDDRMKQQAEQGKAHLLKLWLKSQNHPYVDAQGVTPPPTPTPSAAAAPSDGPGPSPAFSSGRLIFGDSRLPVGMARQVPYAIDEAPEDQQPGPSPNLDDLHLAFGPPWPRARLGAWESLGLPGNSSQLLELGGDNSGIDYGKLFFGNTGLSPCIGTYIPNQSSTSHRTSCESEQDDLLPSLSPSSPPPRPPPSFLRASPSPIDTTPRTRCWLKNLPGHLDYVGLFRSLRNAGRIAAASIYRHDHHQHYDHHNHQHHHCHLLNPNGFEDPVPSSDVLLAFCRPTDCRRFVQQCNRLPLCIDGRVAHLGPVVDHPLTPTERAAVAAADRGDEKHNAYGRRTRVLFTEGPAALVNREALLALAARNDVPDHATVLLSLVDLGLGGRVGGGGAGGAGHWAHAEWQLASIETQAQRLHDALARLVGVRVSYASDPCEGRFRP